MFTVKEILGSEHKIDEKIKKEIILKTIELINNSHRSEEYFLDCKQIKVDGQSIFIKYNENQHNSLLKQIFRDLKLKHNFSIEYINNFIDELVSEILKNGTEVAIEDPLVVDIFDDYFYDVIVYIPLDGIKTTINYLIIGKINIKEFTNKDFEFHNEKLKNLIINNSHHNEKMIKHRIEENTKFLANFSEKTCAEFIIYADTETAIKFAEEECRKVLDLIIYVVSYLHPKSHKVFIGMQGEIRKSWRNTLVARSNFSSYYSRMQNVGAIYEFVINDLTIYQMRKLGMFKISEILKKEDNERTEIERSLLIAIHSFANSQMQTELENEFLSLMICMEIFLNPGQKATISSFVSESMAIILNKPENRKELRDRIDYLYNVRSRIAHGEKVNLDEEDVDELRSYTKTLIFVMIKYKSFIKSTEKLIDKIYDQMQDQKLCVEFDLKKI
jgi:hypothetical protein